MRVVAPAIALGNTVILKASPETPISGGLAIASAFAEAGAPAGVFQAICGSQEFSEAVTTHPGVDMVHFTGSTAVGSRIAAAAGGKLKKVSLELGGNNALVVLADADVDEAAMIGAWSVVPLSGADLHQRRQAPWCTRASSTSTWPSWAERARRISVGDPSDPAIGLGPIVNARQAARGAGLLESAIDAGAVVVEGGGLDGLFFRPTVVTGLRRDMPLWTDEVFAPIAPVMSFSSDDEAIAIVNDTPYGLVNSVLTGDEARGQRFAHRVRSGMVHVNDATCIDEASAPFGGLGASGLGGRAGGEANLEEFTERNGSAHSTERCTTRTDRGAPEARRHPPGQRMRACRNARGDGLRHGRRAFRRPIAGRRVGARRVGHGPGAAGAQVMAGARTRARPRRHDAVLLLPLLIAARGAGGPMAVHADVGCRWGSSFASEASGPELIGTLIAPLVAVGVWAAARIVILVVARRVGPPRSRAGSIVTAVITAVGMVVMLAM